uniref:apolipoprotein Eb-like n=1 Tax=Pristiophorus japonicus TaxID=55135 RepID=UPI00398F6C3B
MKFLAAVLALVLIAGSHGSPLSKPQPNLESAIERFMTFATQMSQTTDDMMQNIRSTELDQKFRALLEDCLSELNVSADGLGAKLGPYGERFNADVAHLREKLARDLGSVRSMVMIYNEEAQLMVKQNLEDVRQTLALYLRKYRKRLTRDREEIRRKFQEYKQELSERGQRTLDDFRQVVEPYARAVGDKLQRRFDDIHQTLSQQAEEAKAQAQVLHGQVSANTESLREALSQRMDEIRVWFETEAQKVSQRFTELFESLREHESPPARN